MVNASEAVVWINRDTKAVMIGYRKQGRPSPGYWCDPIGGSEDDERPARAADDGNTLDLAMQGFPLKDVLTAFAQFVEFKALGSESFPMCRALTSALLGKCYEPNTMSFEDLLRTYGPRRVAV